MNMCNFGAQGLHNLILLPSVHVSLSCEVGIANQACYHHCDPRGTCVYASPTSFITFRVRTCMCLYSNGLRITVGRPQIAPAGFWPKGWAPQRSGSPTQKTWGPEGWGAPNVALFFPLLSQCSFFSFLWRVFSWNCGRDSRPQGAQTRTSAGPRP